MEYGKACFHGRKAVTYSISIADATEKTEGFGGAIMTGLLIEYGNIRDKIFLVPMRLGDTPVPIPNTMVKT